jgi:outer membrane protein TolC
MPLTAFTRTLLSLASLLTATAPEMAAQAAVASPSPLALSLEEATARAIASSDALVIARAEVNRAAGESQRVTGSRLPRLSAYSSVDRALRSEYEGLSFGGDAGAEAPDLPFGSPTTYRTGLSFSQPLFTGGRTLAQGRAADRGEQAAELSRSAVRAQVTLAAAEAYYDAALAERLVVIVDATLVQAESALERAALMYETGKGSEFDWLRAKVARDRQRPIVMRQRGDRDVAMLRLKQLANLDAGVELVLTSALEPDASTEVASTSARVSYAAVREAAVRLQQREALLDAAIALRRPSLALVSSYERVAYAADRLPANREFRTNWTLGARVELPLLTGGQRAGDEAQGRADVAAARAGLRQAEQRAAFAERAAAARLSVAEAAWAASEGAVQEAARAHDIARLRHAEGLAIQLELSDARLALESAQAERARAARDLLVQRLHARLLPSLPSAP